MNKTYLIFRHEFLHTIKKGGWITMTLVVPVLALLGIGIAALIAILSESPVQEITAIGYVDEVGVFDDQTTQGFTRLVPFALREDATQALERNEVTEFIIIPADYTSSRIIQRYTLEKELVTPPATAAMIKSFLTGNLLKDKVRPDIVALIISPLNL